jgi:DNA mismatch endonuclease (patch repair protein)
MRSTNLSRRSVRGARRAHDLVVDAETSLRMGRIRQKDTSAELTVRRIVHRLGARYRVRNRDLPGSPDLANRSRRWAIFVHGCYWHAHPRCKRATVPKRNRAFWLAKFDANRLRDHRAIDALERLGYSVLVVWQCELEQPARVAARLRRHVH